MSWCEANGVDFLFGLAKNERLVAEIAAELAAATGEKADPASLSRWLIRAGYRFKKNSAGQRARSSRRQTGARGMDERAPTEDAA